MKMTPSLLNMVAKWILFSVKKESDLILYVHRSDLKKVLTVLKDHMNSRVKVLIDICGVDFPYRSARFEVVYHLLSPDFNTRLSLKVCVDELTPVASISDLYCAAGWCEREVWDLFGVYFSDHPDLRRILTDYGFEGHPLRKDFPLTGYWEVRYDDAQKRVISEPLELTQEFRSFDFASPWVTKS